MRVLPDTKTGPEAWRYLMKGGSPQDIPPGSRRAMELLDAYASRILAARKRAGLTSLSTREAIQTSYFAESLAAIRVLEERGLIASPAIDVGSGAGIPGIPLKIARPEVRITLLEANRRKVDFLRSVIDELGLDGATVLNARAEDAAHSREHRAAYRLALARAVAPMRVLLEITLPFLARGGVLAAHKGSGAPREIAEARNALSTLGGEVVFTQRLAVPGSDVPAPTLVIVQKVAETPDRYPRRAGIPAKRPL